MSDVDLCPVCGSPLDEDKCHFQIDRTTWITAQTALKRYKLTTEELRKLNVRSKILGETVVFSVSSIEYRLRQKKLKEKQQKKWLKELGVET